MGEEVKETEEKRKYIYVSSRGSQCEMQLKKINYLSFSLFFYYFLPPFADAAKVFPWKEERRTFSFFAFFILKENNKFVFQVSNLQIIVWTDNSIASLFVFLVLVHPLFSFSFLSCKLKTLIIKMKILFTTFFFVQFFFIAFGN